VPGDEQMSGHEIVVIGASAGGVEALRTIAAGLPADLPAAVFVVLHLPPGGTSVLPAILERAGDLGAAHAVDGEPVEAGRIYVAPPDHHLLVDDGTVRIARGPRENGHRPAIDPTMRSAAESYDGGTIGIVLSGSRDDGTAGLMAIKAGGGTAIVQDPDEALYPSMPVSALAHVKADAVLPIARMAAWILEHTGGGRPTGTEVPLTLAEPPGNPGPGEGNGGAVPSHAGSGQGTRFTCPDCGGVLFERHEGNLERFQCSVGHVFSIESLSSAQAEALEAALWAAVRSLEDRAALLKRLSSRARTNDHERSAETFERQAADALDRAATIREAIQGSADEQSIAAES
jgi:two-component system, chemotaxis family, protein-glutamate methylesterase/glutaminase